MYGFRGYDSDRFVIILFLRDRFISHKYKIVDYCLHKKDMRCMMNRVENKNQIVDINGYVHVINGRVLCFKSDLYDLSENSDDVKYLTEFVNGLPTKRCFDASFGDFTIYLRSEERRVGKECG